MSPPASFRWWVAGLLALATALNYLDRQSFPVVAAEVQNEIPFTDREFARLGSLFLLAYAVMYAVGGRLIDRLGTRAGYAVMIVWWSAANFLTGAVSSVLGLGVRRFLLGMGEGGGFPGSAKAVAEWFPPKERSFAFGLFNTGSALGAVVAPPLIAVIVGWLGWRYVFYLTGAAGFAWAAVWVWLYRPPAESQTAATPPVGWLSLFAYREVQGLMVVTKFLSDAAWYFFIFWLPKYLADERGLNIKEIGMYAWVPYAFAGAGSLAGGWLGGFLLGRGWSLDWSRKTALGLSAALLPVSLLIAAAPLSLAILFFGVAMFAHQSWSATIQTLPADLFPPSAVGSVGGLIGSAGSFGGMLFGLIVGELVGPYGYGPAFVLAGVLHPAAFLVVLLAVRRVGPD